MLHQASISQVRSGTLSRQDGHLVAVMCYYPRGLPRAFLDEFRSDLAPDRPLFRDWKRAERELGHEAAFAHAHFEDRFALGLDALASLRNLARRATRRNVYLLCQCRLGERCHREMLILLAREVFAAPTAPLFHDYPAFRRRWPEFLAEGAEPSPGALASMDLV